MPFKSEAQRRWMYAAEARGEVPSGTAERWQAHTPKGKKLPKRVGARKKAEAVPRRAAPPFAGVPCAPGARRVDVACAEKAAIEAVPALGRFLEARRRRTLPSPKQAQYGPYGSEQELIDSQVDRALHGPLMAQLLNLATAAPLTGALVGAARGTTHAPRGYAPQALVRGGLAGGATGLGAVAGGATGAALGSHLDQDGPLGAVLGGLGGAALGGLTGHGLANFAMGPEPWGEGKEAGLLTDLVPGRMRSVLDRARVTRPTARLRGQFTSQGVPRPVKGALHIEDPHGLLKDAFGGDRAEVLDGGAGAVGSPPVGGGVGSLGGRPAAMPAPKLSTLTGGAGNDVVMAAPSLPATAGALKVAFSGLGGMNKMPAPALKPQTTGAPINNPTLPSQPARANVPQQAARPAPNVYARTLEQRGISNRPTQNALNVQRQASNLMAQQRDNNRGEVQQILARQQRFVDGQSNRLTAAALTDSKADARAQQAAGSKLVNQSKPPLPGNQGVQPAPAPEYRPRTMPTAQPQPQPAVQPQAQAPAPQQSQLWQPLPQPSALGMGLGAVSPALQALMSRTPGGLPRLMEVLQRLRPGQAPGQAPPAGA